MPGAEDITETVLYVRALDHGMQRLGGGFPLCNRLLREMHTKLLAHGRGSTKMPGEFRRSQNWVGGTRPGNARFVPPPQQQVEPAMAHLESFLHDDTMPVLIKAALAHVQFETIHPFLDGNGRIGRLLIIFILHHDKLLQQPLLYLSLFFKRNQQTYYELLNQVRETGDWEAWLDFFFTGVREVAGEAVGAARELTHLFNTDRQSIGGIGARAALSAASVHRCLCQNPYNTIAGLSHATGLSTATVQRALDRLCGLGMVREHTGRKRGRVFVYQRYLEILNRDTEPV